MSAIEFFYSDEKMDEKQAYGATVSVFSFGIA